MQAGAGEVERSRARVLDWFARTAPLIEWVEMESPLGELYMARSEVGLCKLMFGVGGRFTSVKTCRRGRGRSAILMPCRLSASSWPPGLTGDCASLPCL